LAYYLEHRISEDIDITALTKQSNQEAAA